MNDQDVAKLNQRINNQADRIAELEAANEEYALAMFKAGEAAAEAARKITELEADKEGWRIAAIGAAKDAQAHVLPRFAAPAGQHDAIGAMVNRFLGWKLPQDFYPDCGISFDGRKDDEWNKNKTWPTGTNLLHAGQAKEMFEYCLKDVATQASADAPTGEDDFPISVSTYGSVAECEKEHARRAAKASADAAPVPRVGGMHVPQQLPEMVYQYRTRPVGGEWCPKWHDCSAEYYARVKVDPISILEFEYDVRALCVVDPDAPAVAASSSGVSEWLRSIDEDGYRTDQERMAARILLKIAPAESNIDPAELIKRWPTARAFVDAHDEEYFESNEPVPRIVLAYAVDLLTDSLATQASTDAAPVPRMGGNTILDDKRIGELWIKVMRIDHATNRQIAFAREVEREVMALLGCGEMVYQYRTRPEGSQYWCPTYRDCASAEHYADIKRNPVRSGFEYGVRALCVVDPDAPADWRKTPDWRIYHSALSQCAELLDNMPCCERLTDTPKFLAAKLAAHPHQAWNGALPELPTPSARMYTQNGYRRASVSAGKGEPLFAADQMQSYARKAIGEALAGVRESTLEEAAQAIESLPVSRDDRLFILRAAETARALKTQPVQASKPASQNDNQGDKQ